MDMECDENNCSSYEDLTTYPFYKLSEQKSLNYAGLRNAAEMLHPFVALQEFYANPNNCLYHTLDFILTNLSFLIKNSDSGSTLVPLLVLLKNITNRINHFELQFADKDRLIVLLMKLMGSNHEHFIKVEGGKIVAEILEMRTVDCCNIANLMNLSAAACTLFNDEGSIAELCILFRALFKRRAKTEFDITPLITWIQNDCVDYLNEENEPEVLLRILDCIVTYYELHNEEEWVQHGTTNCLKKVLSRLCTFMCHPLLRHPTEQLLTIFIEELYCTHTLIWPGGTAAILKEIQSLPGEYQEWPNDNRNVYFVIAYLLMLNSSILWSSTVILESLNQYLSMHIIFAQHPVLKALAMLYPVVLESSTPAATNMSQILFNILRTCKSLPNLLIYHPLQMEWLLKNDDTFLKNLVLMFWLQAEKDDAQILSVFNRSRKGSFLARFLVRFPDSPVSPRISRLISQLAIERKLQQDASLALPLFCNNPNIFSNLLKVKPSIPLNPVNVLNFIKMVSVVLPFLMEDAAVQGACSYSICLLTVMKKQPNALMIFCHFSATIRFLVAKSASKEDVTALAAINLLRRLVNNQLHCYAPISHNTPVQFTRILQGNSQRVLAGLKLLQTVLLQSGRQPLLLSCPKQFFLGLYHSVHPLINNRETAKITLEILKVLIVRKKVLAYSLVTPYSLRLISQRGMKQECLGALYEFLEVWLEYVTRVPFTQVPVDQIRSLLMSANNYKGARDRIIMLLRNC